MPSINKVTLIGHAGKDSEAKFLPNGTQVINFSIATSKKWKEGEEVKEKTEWHNIAIFGRMCEFFSCKKGDLVYVEGEIQSNEFTDKSGDKHYGYKILGTMVRNFTPKPKDDKAENDLEE